MRLLLIRHGKAGDSDAWEKAGKKDFDRPLTREGILQMKKAAVGLRRIIDRIDVLVTSPLVRAVETARIVYSAYRDKPQFLELDLLSGDHPASELVRWIKAHDLDHGCVAFVGHSPDMTRWPAAFISGRANDNMVTMKKGSVAVIDFPVQVALAKGTLDALYHARELRKLAR